MRKLDRRRFGKLAVGAASLSSIGRTGFASATEAQEVDPRMGLVNPQLRPIAAQILATATQMPKPRTADLPALRARNASYARPILPSVAVDEMLIPTRDGDKLRLFIINASAGTSKPGILHMHGGGFIVGSAKAEIRNMQEVAQALDCVVVTVDYRLAPETRWIGSTEDNYSALKWLNDHSAELGVDTKRLAVLGESAGGGHAALLALRARDRGEVQLAFQALIYPMLDDRTGSTRPMPAHQGFVGWDTSFNRFGWRSFLGMEPGIRSVPSSAVPAQTLNLAGLPPTFIGVGSIDLFVDEDIEYAQRLLDTGIPTELLVVPGAFHSFDKIGAATNLAQDFTKAKLNALRRALTP